MVDLARALLCPTLAPAVRRGSPCNTCENAGGLPVLTELQIGCLLIDHASDQPVIMLQEVTGPRAIPIMIGVSEAGAIASELENIRFPRPMTHDLLCNVVAALGGAIERIVISDLREDTFFARVVVRSRDDARHAVEVDARPSDAIALAIRAGAPIYAEPRVVEAAGISLDEAEAIDGPAAIEREPLSDTLDAVVLPSGRDPRVLREFLEQLSTDDFGKYKM